MLKFRGKFRVSYEMDKRTGKPCEFAFVPCKIRKGANMYRYNTDTLCAIIPGKMAMNKLNDHPEIFEPFQIGDAEGTFKFPESLMNEAAEILKPYVKGSNVSPRSRKNMKYVKNIREKAVKRG